ncbi:MAG: histidine phosphatase family protein, partial [Proteobacteria bacterium]|nr:histidine phosphatase family protein [Pseudomonadota bacterium]
MRRLMLLRHAKSDVSRPGQPDRERALTERGQRAASRVGAYLAGHALAPDQVLCSTARRARQTWELIAPCFTGPLPVAFEERIYGASRDDLVALMRA